MMRVVPGERWNHNIHYHRWILAALPPDARAALDVGCGEGTLCRALRERVPRVVGVDADATSIALAASAGGDIEYQCADFMAQAHEAESFDIIASVATLHHMDAEAALARMRDLLRPGGVIILVGVARRSAWDAPYDAVGFFAHRLLKLRHGYWQHPSPISEPALTHRQFRKVICAALPGARFHRHVLFRHSAIWQKPR
jgi:2-polyprenyl-3-methyl-5-hydroxy-6-metoxy-1,4-benzoquinol methylase